MDEIDKSKPRRSYLVTYSQADLQKFPTRESFGEAVAAAFTSKRSKVNEVSPATLGMLPQSMKMAVINTTLP